MKNRPESRESRMRIQISRIRIFAGVLLLLLAAALAFPAAAQQVQRNPDGSVNPTASAVNEQQLLQKLGQIDGRVSILAQRAGVLIQPAGREWRAFHEITLRIIGAVAIVGMLALLVIFYLWRGMVRIEAGRSGRTLVRFNAFERGVHWMTATCFVILAISGLNITFGRPLLLPLLGPETFTAWSQWAKYAHNFLSFPFTLGVVLIFLMWIAGNIPNRTDIEWLKRGGGIVGHKHPAADRFNAGQKMVYWLQILAGGALALTGYLLVFPFYGTNIANMQLAEIIHGITAVLFIAVMLGHIYIGSIGMEGAFEGMWDGTVDANWAKEHHRLWAEKEAAKGHITAPPAQGTMQAAE